MAREKPSDENFRSQTRMPPDLAEWLKEQASENCRSFNGEVVARLKESRKLQEKEAAHAS